MLPSESIERMEAVVIAHAKNERDQLQAGVIMSAAETAHAVRDAEQILRRLKEARTALTLPVYESVWHEGDLTQEERAALADNDPVAGTEYREMATLFVQMPGFVCDVSQALGLRCANRLLRLDVPPRGAATRDPDEDGPSHPPARWPPGEAWMGEAVRLMNARAQTRHDNTHAFTRPLRWLPGGSAPSPAPRRRPSDGASGGPVATTAHPTPPQATPPHPTHTGAHQ